MGLIGSILLSILGLVAATLTTVIARLITDDIKEWLPRIRARLIDRAIRKLPEDQRERYAEEWSAFIDDTPGDLSKIVRAFGLGFAADSIARLVYPGALMFAMEKTQRTVRRFIDITIGAVMIVLLAPLFLFIALAVKIDSPGPMFFRYERIQSDGKKVAELLSFRVMHSGDSTRSNHKFDKSEDTHNSDDLDHPNSNPKITRFGKWLRRTGFSEIPQLINVVRGDLPFTSAFKRVIDSQKREAGER